VSGNLAHLSPPPGKLAYMSEGDDDPVPAELVLGLDDAFRVLEALEDALLSMEDSGVAPGLQDELATVIRLLNSKLGLDEGGVP